MKKIIVEVKTDGPIPHLYSMISIKAAVEFSSDDVFISRLAPVSDKWNDDYLTKCNFSRRQTLNFSDPVDIMEKFNKWVLKNSIDEPVFCSSAVALSWQFVNYYFHRFIGHNPFGFRVCGKCCGGSGCKYDFDIGKSVDVSQIGQINVIGV